MEEAVQVDPERAGALRWVKSFLKAWGQIDPAPEDVDPHAVAALACRLHPRSVDFDTRVVAQREREKDSGVCCYGVVS